MPANVYGAVNAAPALYPTAVKIGAYTLSPGDFIAADISAGGWTGTLPNAPADGARVGAKIISTDAAATNILTLACQGTDRINIAGGAVSTTLTLLYQAVTLQYSATAGLWYITDDSLPLGGLRHLFPDWINVLSYGAKIDGSSDDTTAFQKALNAAFPGQTVYYPDTGADLRTSAPLTVPPGVILRGPTYDTLQLTSGSGEVPTHTRIKPLASFAGNGVIQMLSMTPGGYSAESAQQRVYDVFIDCTALSGSTVNGIWFNGPVYGVQMERVFILAPPHDGIQMAGQTEAGIANTLPYHMRLRDVVVEGAGAYGFSLSATTDSDFVGCLAFACASGGFLIQSTVANERFVGCRAEWTTAGHGFQITGTVTSGATFVDCSTDNNNSNGFYVQATGTGTITINGLRCGNDGHNAGSGGGGFAGLNVNGATCNVAVSDLSTYVGNAVAASTPEYGFAASSSSYVSVDSGVLQGQTAGWFDAGTNTVLRRGANVLEQVGNYSSLSPAYNGVQADSAGARWTGAGATYSLVAANTLPEDQSLLGWSIDPMLATASGTLTSGVLYVVKLAARQIKAISNVTVGVATAGSGLTSGENLVGIYDSTGTLRATSVDQTTNWGGTGAKTAALGSPWTPASSGPIYVAILSVGTTPVTLFRSSSAAASASFTNYNTAASQPRAATYTGPFTALPSTISLSAPSSTVAYLWAALLT